LRRRQEHRGIGEGVGAGLVSQNELGRPCDLGDSGGSDDY
jgi:hypothetical protein